MVLLANWLRGCIGDSGAYGQELMVVLLTVGAAVFCWPIDLSVMDISQAYARYGVKCSILWEELNLIAGEKIKEAGK